MLCRRQVGASHSATPSVIIRYQFKGQPDLEVVPREAENDEDDYINAEGDREKFNPTPERW